MNKNNGESWHLDIGCGAQARNQYERQHLTGIDIHNNLSGERPWEYRRANLVIEKIPFESNSFDSVSAFDFIEHVPRSLIIDGESTYPFVNLMSEIWRVLKPGGLFYSVTPAYPSPKAFQDPTHVNIITDKTHTYFCGAESYAHIYGFVGNFDTIRTERTTEKNAFTPEGSFRKTLRVWHRKFIRRDGLSHILWELQAVK